ncbi:MAG: hypothetical protein WC683_02710 [bacterium]
MSEKTTTTEKKIVVALSDENPVRIVAKDWPVIASAHDYNGEHECQANRVWWIKVRQPGDGRRLVYGMLESGPRGVPAGWRGSQAGYLIPPANGATHGKPDEEATIRAIRRVAGVIGDDRMADYVIADLPARDI